MSSENYRSGFEELCHNVLGESYAFEPYKVQYSVLHEYTPDFVNGDIVVECKGFFRAGDRQKYKAINSALKAMGKRFVFLFQTPDKQVAKGSNQTMAQWAERQDIPWFDLEIILADGGIQC